METENKAYNVWFFNQFFQYASCFGVCCFDDAYWITTRYSQFVAEQNAFERRISRCGFKSAVRSPATANVADSAHRWRHFRSKTGTHNNNIGVSVRVCRGVLPSYYSVCTFALGSSDVFSPSERRMRGRGRQKERHIAVECPSNIERLPSWGSAASVSECWRRAN